MLVSSLLKTTKPYTDTEYTKCQGCHSTSISGFFFDRVFAPTLHSSSSSSTVASALRSSLKGRLAESLNAIGQFLAATDP